VQRILTTIVAMFAATARADDNWPQFRGPDGQGHAMATGVPLEWS